VQGYIRLNTQNNRYWSSQNPHLTHEAPLYPVKVNVWCAVSARRTVVPVFSNKTRNCERYLRVQGQHFNTSCELWNVNYFIPSVIGHQACWFIGKIRIRLAAGGAPVAVKRRAVEPVNRCKNPLCTFVYQHCSLTQNSQVRQTGKNSRKRAGINSVHNATASLLFCFLHFFSC
jgi:hypothetical protein